MSNGNSCCIARAIRETTSQRWQSGREKIVTFKCDRSSDSGGSIGGENSMDNYALSELPKRHGSALDLHRAG